MYEKGTPPRPHILAFDFIRGDGTREDYHHHSGHGDFLPPED